MQLSILLELFIDFLYDTLREYRISRRLENIVLTGREYKMYKAISILFSRFSQTPVSGTKSTTSQSTASTLKTVAHGKESCKAWRCLL